jgi:hypothetical protein
MSTSAFHNNIILQSLFTVEVTEEYSEKETIYFRPNDLFSSPLPTKCKYKGVGHETSSRSTTFKALLCFTNKIYYKCMEHLMQSYHKFNYTSKMMQ